MTALVIDNFAGGGGASLGIEQAIGRPVDVAINHDAEAIAVHEVNHPHTKHYHDDIWSVDPLEVTGGRHVSLAWFSPDCTHFSKAAGRRPLSKNIRGLAWVVIEWAARVRPAVIMLENVEEFRTWGPLDDDGYPIAEQVGETFAAWVEALQGLGYELEIRELRAHEYGAPTIRKRLFVIARCDGAPIVWPERTHDGEHIAYRTAAECIDWSIPAPSIFERAKPLAENTQRRIAAGIKRFVIDAEQPFIVSLTHHGSDRVESLAEPFATITGAHRGEKALVTPYVARMNHDGAGKPVDALDEPLRTVTTQHNKHMLVTPYVVKHFGGQVGKRVDTPLPTITTRNVTTQIVTPTLVQVGWGERDGQAPRVPGLGKPLGTIMATGEKHALVEAFLARHFGGMVGRDLSEPMPTTLAKGAQNQLVTSNLVHLRGTGSARAVDQPLPTITSGGNHVAEVRAFLLKFYGTNRVGQSLTDPMHTVTTKDRLGLVTIAGEDWQIVDIGMRMLTPRELFRAQGFPDGYVIDPIVSGRPLPKTHQVRLCGNSVCPPVARALVAANVGAVGQQHIWRGYELAAAGA